MKLPAILLIGFAILAAPCVYDSTSVEPSVLAAFFAPSSVPVIR